MLLSTPGGTRTSNLTGFDSRPVPLQSGQCSRTICPASCGLLISVCLRRAGVHRETHLRSGTRNGPGLAPRYVAGQLVTFGGVEYQVQETHTSLPGWEPTALPALFKKI